MKPLKIVIFMFVMASLSYAQDPCDDPNAITFHSNCGVEFQLCMDRYELDGHEAVELEIFTNDMGQIDKCSSFICSPCSHGTLEQLPAPNCNFVYTPDEGFYGNDTFYYSLIINDDCSDEACVGKIWTVKSRYTGPDGYYMKASYKDGTDWIVFDEAYDLQWGDYFMIDGSSLPVSQTKWTYTFYKPDGTDGCVGDDCIVEEYTVHTSCSVNIFGKNYGLFRAIEGCTAEPNDGADCFDQESNPETTNLISSQYEDTAMVVITIQSILPITITDFSAFKLTEGNLLSWNVESVINEEYLEVQRSYDGIHFEMIHKISPILKGVETFIDRTVKKSGKTYYRLATYSLSGHVTYTNVIVTARYDLSNVKIYPNPTNNALVLDSGNEALDIVEVSLISMSGKLITRLKLNPSNYQEINMTEYDLITGMYILQIVTHDGQRFSEEVMYKRGGEK